MTIATTLLTPALVAERLRAGHAILVDIREADEFARRHVKGALSRPLSVFETAHLKIAPGQDVVFTCRSGMRTAANRERLAAAVTGEVFLLEGGVDAWAAAGLPIEREAGAPIELNRQVQLAAGLLVLLGVGLGLFLSPLWFGLAAFVGAGLSLAGITGFCGLAILFAHMPWNRALRP